MNGDISAERLLDLSLAAIDATTRPNSWRELCNLVTAELDAKAVILLAYDFEDGRMPLIFGSNAIHSKAAQAVSEAARAGDGQEDYPIYASLSRHPPGRVISEFDLVASPEQLATANKWRQRVLGVTGGKARSVMKVNDVGPHLDCLAVHDSAPHESTLPLRRIAPLVFPLFSRTLETMRVMRALAESYDRMMTLFDQLDFGAAFCTHDGRTIASNATFRAITHDRDGISEVSQRLLGDTASDTHALLDLLAAAGRPGTPPDQLTLALPRPSQGRPLILRAVPTRNRDVASEPVVLLLLIDPESTRRLNTSGIGALGVLSPAELEVCDLLVRGLETLEISDYRNTSIETTRDQIKAACGKLDCRSRLDVLRLAMATSITGLD